VGATATSGNQVTTDALSAAAAYVDAAASDIQAKIAVLGSDVAGLASCWPDASRQAFQILMADYNNYASMLNNALTDIGSGLRGSWANDTEAKSPPEPVTARPELEDFGAYLNAGASEIADKLQQLASYLDDLDAVWQNSASGYFCGLQHEWNIAVEGLFGPGGVLSEIARAMNIGWASYSDAGWSKAHTRKHDK
jgi:WXG100 family type VII secretion target